jgi:hypothetical protein
MKILDTKGVLTGSDHGSFPVLFKLFLLFLFSSHIASLNAVVYTEREGQGVFLHHHIHSCFLLDHTPSVDALFDLLPSPIHPRRTQHVSFVCKISLACLAVPPFSNSPLPVFLLSLLLVSQFLLSALSILYLFIYYSP